MQRIASRRAWGGSFALVLLRLVPAEDFWANKGTWVLARSSRSGENPSFIYNRGRRSNVTKKAALGGPLSKHMDQETMRSRVWARSGGAGDEEAARRSLEVQAEPRG